MHPFVAIPDRPVLFDGGVSTELERRGHDTSGPLWSARVLAEAPADVLAVHRDFAAAGADVLLTATYQASVDGLVRHGVRPSQAARCIEGAVALVRGGAEQAGSEVLVGGSCGSFAATLGGAREYRGYGTPRPGHAKLYRFHRERAGLLRDGGVDILVFETLPDIEEVAVVIEVADDLDVPALVSVTTRDGRSPPDGTPLQRVAEVAARGRSTVAVGVNCLAPEHVLPAISSLAAGTDLPLVVRPNAGDRWTGTAWTRESRGDGEAVDPTAWVAAGATGVGGCCGTRPEDTARMAARLREDGSG